MSLHVTRSKNRLPRLVHLSFAILATLALLITAFPSLAATPQPQPIHPPQAPNATCPPDGQCFADVPASNPFYTFINRIYQQDLVTGYPCGGIGEPCDPNSRPYYRPVNNVTRQQMAKFIDNARHLPGIDIETTSISPSIYISNSTGHAIYAVTSASNSIALFGIANGGGWAVRGNSTDGGGVLGDGITGVKGMGSSGYGVYGVSATNWAGYFLGDVNVTGTCCGASAGTYKIDDPLDPANKYLYHSAVQSPDMLDIYRGHVVLDAQGSAWVQMPDYFQALNQDFDYQLTAIGKAQPNLNVAQEIENNKFQIAGGVAGAKVSWEVTGVRHDPYALQHPIPTQQDKPANEKGKYLHPTEWGQPASSGIDYEEQQKVQQVTQSTP